MERKNGKPLFRVIGDVSRHDKGIFVLCVAYTVFAIAVTLISVALPKIIVAYLTSDAPQVMYCVLIAVGFFVIGAICNFCKVYMHDATYPRITAVRIDLVRQQAVKLLGLEYKYCEDSGFFDRYGMALEATSGNGFGYEKVIHDLFEQPQLYLLTLALSVLIGLRNPFVLLSILLHVGVTVAVSLRVQKFRYSKKEELSHEERHVGYYQKTAKDFTYGKDVRLYDLKSSILSNYSAAILGYKRVFTVIKRREYLLGFLSLLTLLISDVATYGILTYLTAGGMSISDFTLYIAAATSLSSTLTTLSDNLSSVSDNMMYVKDMFQFIDTDLGEKGGSFDTPALDRAPKIEFDHVTFRYPGTDKNIYDDFSLTIYAGQRLALVGINGAGKSTFVKLLTGLFVPDSGEIRIDGRPVGEYSRKALCDIFAVVPQSIHIFAYTVAQNIACCEDGIDSEKLDAVIKLAGLDEKIKSLPKGVDTMMLKIVEEDGAILSGGESQKLAIARALYKGGSCMIMDEPTSALDALAEADIYEKFAALTEDKTAIYISHRLASTKFCDVIALIDGDGLREYGTHDELMEKGGAYYSMFVTQGKYYREGGVSV